MLYTSFFSDKKAKFSATGLLPAKELRKMLKEILFLIEAKHPRVFIDKRYPLEDVAKAHAYVDKGHTKGNVVLVI